MQPAMECLLKGKANVNTLDPQGATPFAHSSILRRPFGGTNAPETRSSYRGGRLGRKDCTASCNGELEGNPASTTSTRGRGTTSSSKPRGPPRAHATTKGHAAASRPSRFRRGNFLCMGREDGEGAWSQG